MAEKIVELGVREVDEVLAELEQEFSAQEVPTLLRLRAAMLTEELFDALREARDGAGMLRCTFPAPGTMVLQYRDQEGPLKPDLHMVQRLGRSPCTEGVSAVFHEGRCTIRVKGPGAQS
jgi:hypothetical protein